MVQAISFSEGGESRMQMTWRDTLYDRIGSIGGDLADSDLRTQKLVMVSVSMFLVLVCVIWTLFAISLDELANAYTIIFAGLMLFFHLLYLSRSGNFHWFRNSIFAFGLFTVLILHFSIGGFTGSKSLSWGLIVPILALLSSKPRDGEPWFISFIVLVAIAGIADPILYPDQITLARSLSQFAFSLITVALIVYLVLVYFVRHKNRAYDLLGMEQEKSERLLLNILPEEVAETLKSGKTTIAERYESTSVLFADFVNFTPMSAEMDPEEMVDLLNEIFSDFDALVEKFDLEKMATIGDCYMVVSGAPRRRDDHARAVAELALEMRDYLEKRPAYNGRSVDFRIGINSGPIIAGVIGKQKFQYDVWGDVVNTASRMESSGIPGEIQIAKGAYELLRGDFDCEPRGKIEIKGKGVLETWLITGKKQKGD
jgi:guanylate cyclase